jgi:hypothetical protein
MRPFRFALLAAVVLVTVSALCGPESARGELKWQWPKREVMRLRIVALAWNHPRSSFFQNEEIFIAEKQLDKEESRLVKLVFGFLPYQPRLSDYGLDYSTLHELRGARDPECDETLAQMMTGQIGDWRQSQRGLRYATDAPVLNLARNKSHLPCYVTDADDYGKPLADPPEDPAIPTPQLKHRK